MEQRITINPGESLPGFPAGHGPGEYLVDFEARTIRPIPPGTWTDAGLYGTNITAPATQAEITTDAQPVEEQGG